MPVLPRFALLISSCVFCLSGIAQDGIFDDPAGLFGVAPDEAKPDAAASEGVEESPLTTQLLEHARRGDLQMADAIASLARTARWSQVDQLLTQLSQRNVDPATLAEMQRRIGSALFLRMKRQEELSDNARKAMDQLAAAAVAQAEAPERLRRAIDQLDGESADLKLAAGRTLLGGGNAAVAELVAAAVSENPPAPRDDILRTLVELGPGGIRALRQLGLYAAPPIRGRAVASLARIDREAHLAELLTALYAADSDEDEIATAAAQLKRISGTVPSRESALEYLAIDFQSKQDKARLIDNDDQMIALWSVNDDRNGVTFVPSRVMTAAYRDVVDAGSRLRRIGGLSYEIGSRGVGSGHGLSSHDRS